MVEEEADYKVLYPCFKVGHLYRTLKYFGKVILLTNFSAFIKYQLHHRLVVLLCRPQ